MQPLSPLACRIALAEARGIGPHTARLLLEHIPSVEALLEGPDLLRRIFPKAKGGLISELKRGELRDRAERIAEWATREQVRVYFVGDEDYPERLRHCPDAPTVLYARGAYSQWSSPIILSVVGTRNITSYGHTMTDRLLSELAEVCPSTLVVSGLAYGVDIVAHRKALALGMPTVAVLAHGFDRIYPALHRQTAEEILRHGAWVSEYPPGTTPERYNFVARNRIIAGMSDATLVIEAGERSGSLITANLAADYNREVLAVPGRITDRYSYGCNHLIASLRGVLVSSAEDITRALGLDLKCGMELQTLGLTPDLPIDHPLLRLIAEYQPVQINELIQRTGISMAEISAELFDLELDGHIKTLPGGLYVLDR